ncbi:STAS domain-containing protein [Nonomuraea sp. NPDC003727]
MDLSQVSFMDCSGLRVLMAIKQQILPYRREHPQLR